MSGKVLITGGAGFIGANLVRLLAQEGFAVTILDDFSKGSRASLNGADVEVVESELLDVPALEAAVAGKDAVVHLAAQTGVPLSLEDPGRDFEINARGTFLLLEACRREQQRRTDESGPGDAAKLRFIFASSNAPLGRQTPPASEDKAPLPVSPYGASKLAGEAYCLAYHGAWGLETVVLRFANVYGPFSGGKTSVVAKFCKDILAGKGLVIDGDGGQTRDFIYVEDLCRAILLSIRSATAGEVFQIATGVETSISELVEQVRRASGRELSVTHVRGRQGDVRKNYSAVSKARELLGWEARVSLEEGLRRTWAWFEESHRRP